MNKPVIVIMTKVPLPGLVKTRLKERFSDEECAKIYQAFLLDTFSCAQESGFEVRIAYTPQEYLHVLEFMLPVKTHFFPQKGHDLGEKMFNALCNVQNERKCKVILIGCDIPLLQPEHLLAANKALDEHDICLGPTTDGGYYLLGTKEPVRKIFENITWGSECVLKETLQAIANAKLKYYLLEKLQDIDTCADIENLCCLLKERKQINLSRPLHTIRVFEELSLL